jgi:hypothetical protein
VRGPSLTLAIVLLSLFVAAPASPGATTEGQALAAVAAERVVAERPHPSGQVLQFLQADAKGRIYLLRGDTLAVERLLPSGKLVANGKPPANRAEGETVIHAALSPDGDSWLLYDMPDHLMLLKSDELRDLTPSGWDVSAVAYTLDGPILAVLPVLVGGGDATVPKTALMKPPFLLRLDDDQRWQQLVPGRVFERSEPRALVPQELRAERSSRLAAGAKATLWVAQQDAYVLKQYSRAGVLKGSLVVGGGRVQWRDRTEDDWKYLEGSARAGGMKLDRTHLANVEAVHVVRALTVQDHRVYLVVETSAGLVLDRWDADADVLQRLQLGNVATGPGRLSLAAGRDGLYLAGAHLGEPVWRLDWQRLEGAKWKPVPDAVVEAPPKAGQSSARF